MMRRRGSTVIIVLWSIATAALLAASVQVFAFRQASLGRDGLQRIQARWAARAGIENSMAMMGLHTEQPVPDDAYALTRDLEFVSSFDLYQASYDIVYHQDGRNLAGPLDEHSRVNINGNTNQSLGLLEDLTPDVASAIQDWTDRDNEAGLLGAEDDYYQTLSTPYRPRNGPLRHVAEMELIAGIWGEYVRNEDWNLNNRLDPNEDDGLRTPPDDEPDGRLDKGWSARLTVHSVDGGATDSGLPRLDLRLAEAEDLVDRCFLTPEQADLVLAFAKNEQNQMAQLIVTPLTRVDEQGRIQSEEVSPAVEPLSDPQLRAVLAETQTYPLYERRPGKLNINTAHPDLIRDLLLAQGFEDAIADQIIALRLGQQSGFTSLLDLRQVLGLTDEQIQRLSTLITTRSNVFTISSRGRAHASGLEVEIVAVVDRSTVPVRIIEYREQ